MLQGSGVWADKMAIWRCVCVYHRERDRQYSVCMWWWPFTGPLVRKICFCTLCLWGCRGISVLTVWNYLCWLWEKNGSFCPKPCAHIYLRIICIHRHIVCVLHFKQVWHWVISFPHLKTIILSAALQLDRFFSLILFLHHYDCFIVYYICAWTQIIIYGMHSDVVYLYVDGCWSVLKREFLILSVPEKKRPDVAAEIPQWAAGIRIAAIMAVEPLAGVV